MVIIGLKKLKKQQEIQRYVDEHNIRKTYIFYFKKFKYEYNLKNTEVEYIEYSDIIMYKYFYRLLEEIDGNCLIVCDEIMRTQNRSDLTYNCMHHYINQVDGNVIVFEYLPIIDDKENMMILLDLNTPQKYKGKSFDYNLLQVEDVRIKPVRLKFNWNNISTTDKQKEKYNKKRDNLFDTLGNKDPDTIPRALQLLAGDYKKTCIENDKLYIARNKRHKLDNVFSYNDEIKKGYYIIIDTHYRRLDFIDFLKKSEMTKLDYIATDLSIDNIVMNSLTTWKARLDSIYAKANIYK